MSFHLRTSQTILFDFWKTENISSTNALVLVFKFNIEWSLDSLLIF